MDQRATGRPAAWWRAALDVVIAVAPLALTFTTHVGAPEREPGEGLVPLVLGGVLVAVALLLRRRWPVAALAGCLLLSCASMLAIGSPTALLVAVLVALFVVAVHRPVRTAVVAWVVCAVGQLAAELATGGWDQRVLAPLSLLAAAAAVGVAVAKQRLVVRSAQERAAVAERTREEEAARRVTAERLRIARELHDVVAHHVAVMGVHAGVAEHLMEADRAQAREALMQVRASGRTALSELGAVVGLLRGPGEEQDTAPVPGLVRLPELLETMRRSGLQVNRTDAGAPDGDRTGSALEGVLDEMNDITAYRVVQESLTNALRHGTGTVDLDIRPGRDAVHIRVSNPVPVHVLRANGSGGSAGSGHGLVGMRERAALVGADLAAGPTADGRFEVRARFDRCVGGGPVSTR